MKSGNQIGNLLNPSKSSIKITLMMAVSIISPKPELADDKIKKFNFVHAMALDVYTKDMKRPDFPAFGDIVKDFDPDAPLEDKGVVVKAQWEKVQKAWGTDDARTTSQSVYTTWSAAYKWQADPDLSPLPPKLAIRDFLNVYMSAPLICV